MTQTFYSLSTRFRNVFVGIFGLCSRSCEFKHWHWVRSCCSLHSFYPKGVLQVWGQYFVQASQFLPHQTRASTSLRALVCELVRGHGGTFWKVPCPNNEIVPNGLVMHQEFLSLERSQSLYLAQYSQTVELSRQPPNPSLVHRIARQISITCHICRVPVAALLYCIQHWYHGFILKQQT